MDDVDVQPEAPPVVDRPGEHGVGGAHPMLRELLRGGHDGLGQQLAAVDHPSGTAVARPRVAVVAIGTDVEHLEHALELDPVPGRPAAVIAPTPPGPPHPTRRSTASWKKAM